METRSAAFTCANGPQKPESYHGTLLVFFNFHHTTIDVFNLKTRVLRSIQPTLKVHETLEGYKTYLNKTFFMAVDLTDQSDILDTNVRMEIDQMFEAAGPLLEKKENEIAQVYLIYEFGDHPTLDDFRRYMRKHAFLKDATNDVKIVTQNEAIYAVHLYEAGYRDGISDKAYMLFFRQTMHRVDTVLFRKHNGHLTVVRSLNRFMNKSFELDEAIEILETMRNLKHCLADCEVFIFELRRREGDAVFAALLDGHNVVFLPWDNRRAAYMNAAFNRMNLDLDVFAEKDQEGLEATKMSNPLENEEDLPIGEDEYMTVDNVQFPLNRPYIGQNEDEGVDPYIDIPMSPIQWNRFLRCAKLLPPCMQPQRVIDQEVGGTGPLPEMPPKNIVESMCDNALKKQRVEEKTNEMNFDEDWLERWEQSDLRNESFLDYESIIDRNYGPSRLMSDEFCREVDIEDYYDFYSLDNPAPSELVDDSDELFNEAKEAIDHFKKTEPFATIIEKMNAIKLIVDPYENPGTQMKKTLLGRRYDLKKNFVKPEKTTALPPLLQNLLKQQVKVEIKRDLPEEDELPCFGPGQNPPSCLSDNNVFIPPDENDVENLDDLLSDTEFESVTMEIESPPNPSKDLKLMSVDEFLEDDSCVSLFPKTVKALTNTWDAHVTYSLKDTGYNAREPPILVIDDDTEDHVDIKVDKSLLNENGDVPTTSEAAKLYEKIVKFHPIEEPSAASKRATAEALFAPLQLPFQSRRLPQVTAENSRIRQHIATNVNTVSKKPKQIKSEHQILWQGRVTVETNEEGEEIQCFVPALPSCLLEDLSTE